MPQIKEPRIVTDPQEKEDILSRLDFTNADIRRRRTEESNARIKARDDILPYPLETQGSSQAGQRKPLSIGEALAAQTGGRLVTDPEEKAKWLRIANTDPESVSGTLFGLKTGAGAIESAVESLLRAGSSDGDPSFSQFLFDHIDQLDKFDISLGDGPLKFIPKVDFKADPNIALKETQDEDRRLTRQRELTQGINLFGLQTDILKPNEAIAARPDIQEQKALSIMAGQILAAVGDPTSALPLAPFAKITANPSTRAYLSAVFMGAGVGGGDVALYQQAREGELNWEEIAMGAALGAVLGGVATYGISKFRGFSEAMEHRAQANEPFTEADVQKLLGAPQKKKPRETKVPERPDVIELPSEDFKVVATERTVEGVEESSRKLKQTVETAIEIGDHAGLVKVLNETLGLPKALEPPDPANAITDREFVISAINKQYHDAARKNLGKEPVPSTPKNVRPIPKENWQEIVRRTSQTRDEHLEALVESQGGDIRTLLHKANMEEAARLARETEEAGVPPKAGTTTGQNLTGQEGFANTQLLSAMAGGSIGWLGAENDKPGWAIVGALIGGAVPYGFGMVRRIGKSSVGPDQEANISFQVLRAQGFGTPLSVVKNYMGRAGSRLAKGMERAQNEAETHAGRLADDMDKVRRIARANNVSHAKIAQAEKDARRILQGSLDEKKASKAAVRISKAWRKVLNTQLDEAANAGIITKARANELKLRAATKGYFPRVYNEAYLTSPEGKEHFIKTLLETSDGKKRPWTKERLEKTLKSIINDEDEVARVVKDLPSGKQIFISRKLAERMMDARRKSKETARSGHLEMRRAIHPETEELLEPFLVPDPRAAMLQYLDETSRRIMYAKEFGANDELALSMLSEINKKYGNAAAEKVAGEIYWQRVGDSRSSQVMAAAEQNAILKQALGQINAYQTLKLAKAQVANAAQVLVHGSLYASRLSGGNPLKGMQLLYSIARDLKRNPGKYGETARRSGAALETQIMQTVGEWAGVNHRILGREVRGLEWINNPTKFLEVTGFVSVEKFNRGLAANMGRSYAEEVMEDLTMLRKLGRQNTSKYRRAQRAARELGFDPNASMWTEADVLRAALRWSDAINFRNTPGYMAIGWTHPNATWFRKFKAFSFNHARFLFENIVKPAWDNELSAVERARTVGSGVVTMAAAAAVFGMPVDELRRMLVGDDRELTATQRYIRAFTAIGGAGIWYDIVTNHNPLTATLGPAVSDVETIGREVTQMFKGKDGPSKTLADILTGTLVLPREYDIKELIEERLE